MIWSQTNRQALMHVQYDTDSNFSHSKLQTAPSNNTAIITVPANRTTDFTGHARIQGLKPDTVYYYRIWFSVPPTSTVVLGGGGGQKLQAESEKLTGSFRTAPSPLTSRSISFIVGGDLAGQKYCRRVDIGYPIFSVIKALSPDFFVFNGDQIYGDNACPAQGPANVTGWHNIEGNFSGSIEPNVDWTNQTQLNDIYNRHWQYNRDDTHLQALLKNTSLYSQADDHEVANDYGGPWSYYNKAFKDKMGFSNVVKAGIHVFFNYSPINPKEPDRIYRLFNWGKNMDLFILDGHSYRSRNDMPDTFGNKTLFGKDQVQWLEQGLKNSNATWKIVSDDDPTMIPNCSKEELHQPQGCDNWATDGKVKWSFANERDQFLKFLDDNNIKNVVFITTDTHFPSNIVLEQDFNHDGRKLLLHEFVSGPLNSGTFGPDPIDPTVNATYLYKETGIFNFGYYKIQKESDGKVHFIAEVRGIEGITRPGSHLDLKPD